MRDVLDGGVEETWSQQLPLSRIEAQQKSWAEELQRLVTNGLCS